MSAQSSSWSAPRGAPRPPRAASPPPRPCARSRHLRRGPRRAAEPSPSRPARHALRHLRGGVCAARLGKLDLRDAIFVVRLPRGRKGRGGAAASAATCSAALFFLRQRLRAAAALLAATTLSRDSAAACSSFAARASLAWVQSDAFRLFWTPASPAPPPSRTPRIFSVSRRAAAALRRGASVSARARRRGEARQPPCAPPEPLCAPPPRQPWRAPSGLRRLRGGGVLGGARARAAASAARPSSDASARAAAASSRRRFPDARLLVRGVLVRGSARAAEQHAPSWRSCAPPRRAPRPPRRGPRPPSPPASWRPPARRS